MKHMMEIFARYRSGMYERVTIDLDSESVLRTRYLTGEMYRELANDEEQGDRELISVYDPRKLTTRKVVRCQEHDIDREKFPPQPEGDVN